MFFTSLLSILNDCECVSHTSLPGSLEREILGLRLEQAVYALQQILSLAVDQGDLESEAFLCELLRNYQLLQIELNRLESSTHCTNIAVYTLESTKNSLLQITNLLSVYQIVSLLFHPFITTSFQLITGTNLLYPIYFLSLNAQVPCSQGLCKRPM